MRVDDASRRALLATLVCAGILAAIFSQLGSAEVWATFAPGDCSEYCERFTHCGLAAAQRGAVQQPLNSWSNLAFVFAGALALFRAPMPSSYLFAASCVVLGIGSFLFHASVTAVFQWLDVVGMYLVEVSLVAWAFHRTWGIPYSRLLPLALAADVALAVFKWQLNTVWTLVALGAAIAAAMIVQVRTGKQALRHALLPLLLITVAYGVRALDVQKVFCAPDSWIFQGHALWHLLCAVSVYLSFQFFAVAGSRTASS